MIIGMVQHSTYIFSMFLIQSWHCMRQTYTISNNLDQMSDSFLKPSKEWIIPMLQIIIRIITTQHPRCQTRMRTSCLIMILFIEDTEALVQDGWIQKRLWNGLQLPGKRKCIFNPYCAFRQVWILDCWFKEINKCTHLYYAWLNTING